MKELLENLCKDGYFLDTVATATATATEIEEMC